MEFQSAGREPPSQRDHDDHPVDVLPTAGEGEIMDYLRRQLPPRSEVNQHLASRHPSEHPPCYVAAGPRWTSPATQGVVWDTPPHGRWKEKQRAAVRGVATSAGSSTSSASSTRYTGVKRELQFHEHNGANTGWTMIQYQLLRGEGNNFVIEDKMIFCKVFNQKSQAAGQLHHHARPVSSPPIATSPPTIPGPPLQGYSREFFEDLDERLLSFNAGDHPLYDDVPVSELIESTGGVWDNFIKIHSKDHQDVYATCICCDRMLRAHSKNGTSRLKRHTAPGAKCSATPCTATPI